MSRRKTVEIKALIEHVNRINRESTCAPDIREGWNSLLEHVMHEANVYVGFGYLRAGQVPNGHKPGIIFDEGPEHNHQFPDESRRFYYVHRALGGNPPAKGTPGTNPKHYTAAGRA